MDAINSGKVSLKVGRHQSKHFHSANNDRSHLFTDNPDDAQKVILELAGTGSAVIDGRGNWLHKERVIAKRLIGTTNDEFGNTNNVKTRKAMIVYAKDGAHIYPRE